MASSNESDCVCEIRVEPVFGTNQELKEEILNELNFRLLTEMNQEAMPLRRPKILVFRPTGRSGDEFQKKLATVLTGDSVYYLIMAYTAKPGKMIEIPSDYQEKIKEFTTQLVISGGKLVPYDNENYKFNKKSFLKLAEEICRAFPHVKIIHRPPMWEPITAQVKSNYPLVKKPCCCCIFKPNSCCCVGCICSGNAYTCEFCCYSKEQCCCCIFYFCCCCCCRCCC